MTEHHKTSSHGAKARDYWKKNIQLLLILLSIWFTASFLMGIVFANELDQFRFFGFKLGFWMAQQGSIFVFVVLVFVYVYKMNLLDHRYGVDEDEENSGKDPENNEA